MLSCLESLRPEGENVAHRLCYALSSDSCSQLNDHWGHIAVNLLLSEPTTAIFVFDSGHPQSIPRVFNVGFLPHRDFHDVAN